MSTPMTPREAKYRDRLYETQDAARAMLVALKDAWANVGRTDMAWTLMSARERVASEDRLAGRLDAAIAQAEAAGIKAS